MRLRSRSVLLLLVACRGASSIGYVASAPTSLNTAPSPGSANAIPGRTFDETLGAAAGYTDVFDIAFSGSASLEDEYVVDDGCFSGPELLWFGEREWESPIMADLRNGPGGPPDGDPRRRRPRLYH
jgi:hypothetical protein